LIEQDPNEEPEEDGANVDLDAQRKGKCAVVRTSTRQVISIFFIKNIILYKFKEF
jgi:26S proteasome regulatory subunit T5